MPRSQRIVVPGLPHHVIQRGNRQQRIFEDDADRRLYVSLLRVALRRHDTQCLAWCLMDNHVHLVLRPATADGLRAPLASVHTAYSFRTNKRLGVSGHLFQGRFASYPMDDPHLMVAVRYVENNPVKAGLVASAEDWRWSSARAHLGQGADGLTDVDAIGGYVANWKAYLTDGVEAAGRNEAIEAALRSGRAIGDAMPGGGQTVRRPRGRPRKMETVSNQNGK
jgi:putative transposase